ncbi:MAG: sigma 54-interacting transcriptional regulator [Candidatus Sumerlaeia bacterium]|nr:sigma 54-interacting transcriptional regulator [Candidatus Sumerlaeia bacterium]
MDTDNELQQIHRPSELFGALRAETIGRSKAFLDFQERLQRVAPIDRPVLLIGERGTGKEKAARWLHGFSPRADHELVTLNCAALAPSLIESELFGHEEGAFTGATRKRIGRFEAANGGTLFLDEISLIPIETQEKILRVVEYGTFERVGGTRPVRVNVRIIGATNTDLAREAAAGRFKRDLLDRLSFEVLFLPPLRERQEDILLLAGYFAARMAAELGRPGVPEFSDGAIARLLSYPWPGNIRELKNVIERAVYRSEDFHITEDEVEFDPFRSPYAPLPAAAPAAFLRPQGETPVIPSAPSEPTPPSAPPDLPDLNSATLPEAIERVELFYLRRALKTARFNQRVAAKNLGLTYHQFRRLYRKHRKTLTEIIP